jgi:hypothetical protein
MVSHRIKITFPDSIPIAEVEEAVEARFGGMGSAYRGPGDRIVFLHNLEMPFELVTRQLTAFQEDGLILSWHVA